MRSPEGVSPIVPNSSNNKSPFDSGLKALNEDINTPGTLIDFNLTGNQ